VSTTVQQNFDLGLILSLAARGWHLFPVEGRGKKPLIAGWPKKASADTQTLEYWSKKFSACNWGMATGSSSGVFVLDVDGEAGLCSVIELEKLHLSLPQTLKVQTGNGRHLYFKWPVTAELRNSASKLGTGLDVRAAGGYVIVPPSLHSNGKVYKFIDGNAEIATAPDWLIWMLTKRKPGKVFTHSAKERLLEFVFPQGQRNDRLTKLAGIMRRPGMATQSIRAALLTENRTRCRPPLAESEVAAIAESVSRYPVSEEEAPLQRRAELLALSEVEAREVSWLWDPYLAFGALAMLSGDPASGKTFVALAIAAAVTVGKIPYASSSCAPCDVLYLSKENSAEHVVRPRFDSLGGDPKRFHLLQGSIFGEGESAKRDSVYLADIAVLRDAILKTRCRLMVVDPIQSYLGADVDAHRANETRPILDGLSQLAREFEVSILMIRHLSKAPTARAIHRGLGSIDLTGAVRTELMAGCAPDDSTQRALVQVKSNLGQFGKSLSYVIDEDGLFRWTGESALTAFSLLAAEASADDRGAGVEADDFLRQELRGGPRPAVEILRSAHQAGLADRTLRRAKGRLRIKARKLGMDAGWEWALPEDGQK
jgi:hypothetical protein